MPTVLKSGPAEIFMKGTGISNNALINKTTTRVGVILFNALSFDFFLFVVFFIIISWHWPGHGVSEVG